MAVSPISLARDVRLSPLTAAAPLLPHPHPPRAEPRHQPHQLQHDPAEVGVFRSFLPPERSHVRHHLWAVPSWRRTPARPRVHLDGRFVPGPLAKTGTCMLDLLATTEENSNSPLSCMSQKPWFLFHSDAECTLERLGCVLIETTHSAQLHRVYPSEARVCFETTHSSTACHGCCFDCLGQQPAVVNPHPRGRQSRARKHATEALVVTFSVTFYFICYIITHSRRT